MLLRQPNFFGASEGGILLGRIFVSLTVGELFWLKPSFSLWRSTVWVSTHSCWQGSFFVYRTGLSGKSEAILNCNFGHICCHQWVYGKYVMWPLKEYLDNIQSGNKRALDQTDRHKDQTTLSHCPYQNHVYSGPHWLAVPQSAGIVADNFGSPALILCVNSHLCRQVPEHRCKILWNLL